MLPVAAAADAAPFVEAAAADVPDVAVVGTVAVELPARLIYTLNFW